MERFSFECRKTKTKVITLTNHNSRKQSIEPIRARSKYMSPVPSAGKRVQVNHDWFTYVQKCMQVLFNKNFILDRRICHFHITSYKKELTELW